MKRLISPVSKNSSGFTIIELTIATAVFSTALLILILGVVEMTNSYTKGLIQTQTQNTARSVASNIAQAIQFSSPGTINTGGMVTPPTVGANGWFCAENNVYTYVLGQEVNVTNNALVVNAGQSCSNPPPLISSQVSSGGQELLSPHMRLAYLSVTGPTGLSNNLYTIDVRVVYGDDDLLCNPADTKDSTASCGSNGTMPESDGVGDELQCKGQTGDQFCAVSELKTTVQARITNDGS